MFRRPTTEASTLKKALEKLGVRVLAEVNDGYKTIDLSIPDSRMNIEVDGTQHLTDPYQLIADIKRSNHSSLRGYDTIRVPNILVRNELGAVASAIAEAAKIREDSIMETNNLKQNGGVEQD